MPLGKNVNRNIRELMADNRRSGRARGAGGKPRSRQQIVAVALSVSRRAGKKKKKK